MLFLTKKKREKLTWLFGRIWFYFKTLDKVEDFVVATDVLTEACVELGINWYEVEKKSKSFAVFDAYQHDCL